MTVLGTRRLGQTDLHVSPIGLGCMAFAGKGFVERIYQAELTREAATSVVTSALSHCITWFDTAEMYGHADQLLADALQDAGGAAEKITLATKWNPMLRRAAGIARGVDPRLRELGDPILHQIHWPRGSVSSLRSQLHAMARLYHADAIQAVGVSNFNAEQMRTAAAILREVGVPLATNQVQASLLHRDIETNGVLDTARELGVTLIGYFPLQAGLLTGKFHKFPDLISTTSRMRRRASRLSHATLKRTAPLLDELRTIGDRYTKSAGQVALNWLITYYGDSMVAIPGATTGYHAVDHGDAMTFRITDAERQTLAELADECTLSRTARRRARRPSP